MNLAIRMINIISIGIWSYVLGITYEGSDEFSGVPLWLIYLVLGLNVLAVITTAIRLQRYEKEYGKLS